MDKIKNENYVNIQGWMINELGLKGNDLLIYAIIYSFSQDGNSKYLGGIEYLMNWTKSTKQGVIKNLKSLLEKNLIFKEEAISNKAKYCKYWTNMDLVNKVYLDSKQSLPRYETKFTKVGKQSLPNNIIYNKYNNKNNKKYDQRDYKDLNKFYNNI